MNYLVVCVGCFDLDWRVFLNVTASRRVCVLLLVTDSSLGVCWLWKLAVLAITIYYYPSSTSTFSYYVLVVSIMYFWNTLIIASGFLDSFFKHSLSSGMNTSSLLQQFLHVFSHKITYISLMFDLTFFHFLNPIFFILFFYKHPKR